MWIWAGFSPHPPIIVPEVGRGREREAEATLKAMKRLGEVLPPPEALLVLSPHAPFAPGKLTVLRGRRCEGSFASFGVPEVVLACGAPEEREEALVVRSMEKARIPLAPLFQEIAPLDHGALVPLYYLFLAWGKIPPLLLLNPAGLSPPEAWELGRALKHNASSLSWGLLASGDLSHGVTPGAPGEYHPYGEVFDALAVASLREGKSGALRSLSREKRRLAQECGLNSLLCAFGLAGEFPFDVLSYEAPFGVGYCVAYRSLSGLRGEPS